MSLAKMWALGHKRHSDEKALRIANALKCLRLVTPLIRMDSVVDYGCGIGAWLYAALSLGAGAVKGIDGEWITNTDTVIDKNLIEIADLAVASPTFHKEFDLAMSIEVAEHLPPEAAAPFVDSLISASNYILFSAAIPKQGGVGHLNEQPLSYWVEKFWARGYVPLEPIRPYIATDLSIYSWLRQNLVMFVSYDHLIRSEALLRHARPINDFKLRYRS